MRSQTTMERDIKEGQRAVKDCGKRECGLSGAGDRSLEGPKSGQNLLRWCVMFREFGQQCVMFRGGAELWSKERRSRRCKLGVVTCVCTRVCVDCLTDVQLKRHIRVRNKRFVTDRALTAATSFLPIMRGYHSILSQHTCAF